MATEREQLTVQEVAKKYGLSRQAIDKRIKKYKVPVETFGGTRVVKRSDLYLLKIDQ